MLYSPSYCVYRAGRQVGDRRHVILATLLVSLKVTVGTKGVSSACLALLCLSAFKISRDCIRLFSPSCQGTREAEKM